MNTLELLSGLGLGDNSFALVGPAFTAAAEIAADELERERGWKFEVALGGDDDWHWYRRTA